MDRDRLVRAQVDVKMEDDAFYFEVVCEWLLGATPSILPGLWRQLEAALPLEEPTPFAEHSNHGAPSSLYAYLTIYSRPWDGPASRIYGPAGLEWFKEQLEVEARPLRAVLGIEVFDSHGRSDLGWHWNVWVESDENLPAWVRLGIECMPNSVDTDPHTPDVSRRWGEFVRSSIQELNPSFGYVGERVTSLDVARGEYNHSEIVKRCDILRGSSWVTILPSQMVERFGGVGYLRDTGMFFNVEQVPSGAAMLQVTEGLAEFDQTSAARVAKILSDLHSRRTQTKEQLQARRSRAHGRQPRLP